jgi:hypothetical protein
MHTTGFMVELGGVGGAATCKQSPALAILQPQQHAC